jgi:multidrug transporter EmrE-like cation transporter
MTEPAHTPLFSILCFVVASLLGAVGQFLYKSGAEHATKALSSYVFNARILAGVVSYIAVMVLFVAAFKKGGRLTVLYPIYASTFIWAAMIALAAYGTPIKPINVGGMVLLVLGMYLMGRS